MQSKRIESRRRRVVVDEAIQQAARGSSPPAESPARRAAPKRKYAAQAKEHRLLSEWVPRRWSTMVWFVAAAALAFAALGGLEKCLSWPQVAQEPRLVELLSGQSPRSLAAWLSASLMLACAILSAQIFTLRRSRRDDYRGTYRLWIAITAWFVLGSANRITGWVAIGQDVAARGLQLPALQAGSWLGTSLALSLLALAAVRLAFELRGSRLALAFALAYLLTLGVSWIVSGPGLPAATPPALIEAARLLAAGSALFGLVATTAFARFLLLDIQGAGICGRRKTSRGTSRRGRRRSKARAVEPQAGVGKQAPSAAVAPAATGASSTPAPASPLRTSPPMSNASLPPQRTASPLAAKVASARGPVVLSNNSSPRNSAPSAIAAPPAEARPLSRADRKRLKKLQREQRRNAA